MADPSTKTTVTIGDDKFNALSVQFGVATLHDHIGMPQMGTLATTISVKADMHDSGALKFATLQSPLYPGERGDARQGQRHQDRVLVG